MKTEDQLKVIEKVKEILNERTRLLYLCPIFRNVLDLDYSIDETKETITTNIPLFTLENAQQFADPEYPMVYAWWPKTDKARRLQFLEWMENELRSQ